MTTERPYSVIMTHYLRKYTIYPGGSYRGLTIPASKTPTGGYPATEEGDTIAVVRSNTGVVVWSREIPNNAWFRDKRIVWTFRRANRRANKLNEKADE